jgi:hypothetical protein
MNINGGINLVANFFQVGLIFSGEAGALPSGVPYDTTLNGLPDYTKNPSGKNALAYFVSPPMTKKI